MPRLLKYDAIDKRYTKGVLTPTREDSAQDHPNPSSVFDIPKIQMVMKQKILSTCVNCAHYEYLNGIIEINGGDSKCKLLCCVFIFSASTGPGSLGFLHNFLILGVANVNVILCNKNLK